MKLADIIERAKKRDAVRAPINRPLIQIRLDGTPTHKMTNAVAAFQGEFEDVFLRPLEIVSGGAGCLIVEFDVGAMDAPTERRIAAFIADEKNVAYFRRRYGIAAMSFKPSDDHTA